MIIYTGNEGKRCCAASNDLKVWIENTEHVSRQSRYLIHNNTNKKIYKIVLSFTCIMYFFINQSLWLETVDAGQKLPLTSISCINNIQSENNQQIQMWRQFKGSQNSTILNFYDIL